MSGDERAARPGRAPKRAGLMDVARAVGVSHTTVSNAFNRPDQLSPALRERILRTAAELGFGGPDPSARSLRRGRADAIGVVFSEPLAYAFGDPAAVAFLQGVCDVADRHPLTLVLVPGSLDRPSRAPVVRNAAVDGFIVYSTPPETPVVMAAFARRLPTVIVDSPATDGVDFVTIDDRGAAATAVRHLLELGHRRLGVLVLPLTAHGAAGPIDVERRAAATSSWGKARLDGCAEAIAEAGLDWAQVAVEECAASSLEAGRVGAHALLGRAPPTTAIFAFSDPLALGARLAVHDRGLEVPGDLSIVGFDDTAPAAEGLTTVHQPHYDKGRLAAERLVGFLGERPTPPRRQLLPTRLVVRESTGPVRRETAALGD